MSIQYESNQVRKLVKAAFSDDELHEVCFDHFYEVYEKFSNGMGRTAKILHLIDYCKRHGKYGYLLEIIKEHNPYQFEVFNNSTGKINTNPGVQIITNQDNRTLVEIITTCEADISELTSAQKEGLIIGIKMALANALNIPSDEVKVMEIKTGSIILNVSLPTEIIDKLLTLEEDFLREEIGIKKLRPKFEEETISQNTASRIIKPRFARGSNEVGGQTAVRELQSQISTKTTIPNLEELRKQINARRTFAIISHPDAGKTTLTEKLLLYGNAIHLAGSVRARRNQRSATSDWMKMEQERGISITSTVLQFPYKDHVVNLLDTPGHQDFSEDTYRTLTAADCAVMVLDAAKGVEEQTLKLFEVCRRRGIPVFTFINKMDRPALDPLGLLDEVETVLKMQPVPMNWPIGDGDTFMGVYDRKSEDVHLYDRTAHNQTISPEYITTLDDPRIEAGISDFQFEELHLNIGLLDELAEYDHEKFLSGEQTAVYFGSALTNFGVQLFLDDFIKMAPPPSSYPSDAGEIDPVSPGFSGFVFKIQANMDPRHRDSVAFLRICSGRFERNVQVKHPKTDKIIKLSRTYTFFADERAVVDEAYAGDIIGLPGNREFGIGDTISSDGDFNFDPIPRFAAEHYARLINLDVGKQKQFLKGIHQLESEGAMQVLYETDATRRDPILAVVGVLQFEVVQARLDTEYNVKTKLEPLPHQLSRWVEGPQDQINQLPWRYGMMRTEDVDGRLVALFSSPHELSFYSEKYPDIQFLSIQ